MIEISDAPSMKKEKKRKSKKDKDAENADSDDGKKRRESQSSQGSISPKPGARRRNSSVSSGPFDEVCQNFVTILKVQGKKRRNSGAYDSSDSASSTSPYRGKKSSQNYYPQVASYSSEASYRKCFIASASKS